MRHGSSPAAPLLGLFLLLLSACATRGGDIPYNQTGFTAPDPAPAARSMAEYKLTPGDVINIRVYELETVSGDLTVDGVGRVNVPLLGLVPADGRTTSQFETDLTAKLKEKYLQDPHVIVVLKAAAARTVTVDGAVGQPGVYAISPATTLIQTIALARGLGTNANPRRVVVFRQIEGARRAAAFDLKTIRNGKDPDPQIYPADIIVVDGSELNETYRTLLRSIPLVGLFTRF